jgi:Flp pilus assembly protein TadG
MRANLKPSTPPKAAAGLAAVEMMFALPFLLLIIAGMIDIGRAFYQYTTLDKLQRSGAFVLARSLKDDGGKADITSDSAIAKIAEMKEVIIFNGEQEPVLPGLSADDMTVTALTDYRIQVSTAYTYQSLGIFSLRFVEPIVLTASAVVRITE